MANPVDPRHLRRLIARRRRVIVALAVALIVLPLAANAWAIRGARHAMVSAVEKAELTAARAAAVDTFTNLRAAMNYADAAARRPGLAARIRATDRMGMQAVLDSIGAVDLFRGLVVFNDSGVVASTEGSGTLADPAAWQPGL